jgi:hypothetical protein
MHLVGYLYEDYHDAQSLEHKVLQRLFGRLILLDSSVGIVDSE